MLADRLEASAATRCERWTRQNRWPSRACSSSPSDIRRNEFLRGLRLAQGIADRKSTMPMLANVLLRTQGKNQLLVAATDLNVSLTDLVDRAGAGRIGGPARRRRSRR